MKLSLLEKFIVIASGILLLWLADPIGAKMLGAVLMIFLGIRIGCDRICDKLDKLSTPHKERE